MDRFLSGFNLEKKRCKNFWGEVLESLPVLSVVFIFVVALDCFIFAVCAT